MAHAATPTMNDDLAKPRWEAIPKDKRLAIEAYQILYVAFFIAPLVAGIDKFFNLLTNWENYLAPMAYQITGTTPAIFMRAVGVIEIIVAFGVLLLPRAFSYVIAIWMALIVINLLVLGTYYDIALRDFGLFLGALAFARLALIHSRYTEL